MAVTQATSSIQARHEEYVIVETKQPTPDAMTGDT
jgi:hypothetical protein